MVYATVTTITLNDETSSSHDAIDFEKHIIEGKNGKDKATTAATVCDNAALRAFARDSLASAGGKRTVRANEWRTFRDGKAILACARRAFPESYDACASTRGRKGFDEVTEPLEVARMAFARERAPVNVDLIARGDFNATYNALAMLFWVAHVRDGDVRAVEFSMRLDASAEAYCRSAATRERARERGRRAMMRKTQSANATPMGDRARYGDGVEARVARASSMPSSPESLTPSETATTPTRRLRGASATVTRGGDSPKRRDMETVAGSGGTSLSTIDDWETLTEVRWELEKTKHALEARERELASIKGSPLTSTANRASAIKVRELSDLLATEREMRANLASVYEKKVQKLRDEVVEVLRALILTDENMADFNSVDVSTKEGRDIAQVMIDVMDRVRKVHDDMRKDQSKFIDESESTSSPTADGFTSPSFLARLDSLDLSDDSFGPSAIASSMPDQRGDVTIPDDAYKTADSLRSLQSEDDASNFLS